MDNFEALNEQFLKAVFDKNLLEVKNLYKKIDINFKNAYGVCPLAAVAKYYDLNNEPDKEICNLIKNHPQLNVNIKNNSDRTVFYCSNSPFIKELISEKVHINAKDHGGNTALMHTLLNVLRFLSTLNESCEIGTILIENGADVNLGNDHQSPIHVIADYNLDDEREEQLFDLIINHPQINLNKPNRIGQTILHLASNIDIIEKLLTTKRDKIDLDSRNDLGETPLMHHMVNRNNAICQLLIEHGANVNIRNNKNQHPFHEIDSYQEELIDAFIGKIDINLRGERGLCVLCYIKNCQKNLQLLANPLFDPVILWTVFYNRGSEICEKVIEIWNLINSKFFVRHLMDDLRKYFGKIAYARVVHGVWYYLSSKPHLLDRTIWEEFFEIINDVDVCAILHTKKEISGEFMETCMAYKKNYVLDCPEVIIIFQELGDCEILWKMLEYRPSKIGQLPHNLAPFVYVLFNTACKLDRFLNDLRQGKYRYDEKLISKYFIFELNKPKSLIELTRNVFRSHLFEKYGIRNLHEMIDFLKDINLPPGIRDIITLKQPIYNVP